MYTIRTRVYIYTRISGKPRSDTVVFKLFVASRCARYLVKNCFKRPKRILSIIHNPVYTHLRIYVYILAELNSVVREELSCAQRSPVITLRLIR